MDILRIRGLRIGFTVHGIGREVVKGVSLRVPAGRTVALVGESGSGKSVISQAIMGLLPRNGGVLGGEILFRDPQAPEAPVDIATLPAEGEAIRALRGGRIGMIFQEPMSSLSPVHTIGNQIDEALQLHRPAPKAEARGLIERMLERVGFKNPARAYDMYSFELSGGLRQRAMLAMALICRPALLIADEPTTALDVTIQAQILDLMRDLRERTNAAIIFITHDLGVVAEMAENVAVMYGGQIVEYTDVRTLFKTPKHPYTVGLLESIPVLGETRERLAVIPGTVPTLIDLPPGCRFAGRCAARIEHNLAICTAVDPDLLPVEEGHVVRCWLYHDHPPSSHRAPQATGRSTDEVARRWAP